MRVPCYAMFMDESDILRLIESDAGMMGTVRTVAKLGLPDWAIGAGFVRNKIWDNLHGFALSTPPTDIDVAYFDPEERFPEEDVKAVLERSMPALNWEPVNQATVHGTNEEDPYASTEDALSKWPETATSVAVTMKDGTLALIAPHGIHDLVNMIVRPTPAFVSSEKKKERFRARLASKNWMGKWPKLRMMID